jgi:hypothetical protein
MRITGGAVSARKFSKGTLIDRVSAEACNAAALPT